MQLPDRDLAILNFEEQWRRHSGAKEEAARAEFGLSSARYYQRLNAIIKDPAAVAAKPMLVNAIHRANRERAARRNAREFL